MERYFDTALNNRGEPSVGLTVTVTDSNGAVAILYSDNGVTQMDNPFYTDKNGAFYFYAANGRYTVSLTADGVAPASIKDIILLDPADKYLGDSLLAGQVSADLTSYKSDVANTTNGKGADLVANATKKVASISALRALRVPQGSDAQTVELDGYTSANDGGGGTFIWSSTATNADNGGTIIQPNSAPASGRWLRLFAGQVNVKWFGAKFDGSTDDTAALQTAMDATNGFVILPTGTSIISAQLVIRNNCFGLIGQSQYTTTLSKKFNGDLILVPNSGVTCRDFGIAGNGATYTGGGIKPQGYNFLGKMLRITDTADSCVLFDPATSSSSSTAGVYATIADCFLQPTNSSTTMAIRCTGTDYATSPTVRKFARINGGSSLVDFSGMNYAVLEDSLGTMVRFNTSSAKIHMRGNRLTCGTNNVTIQGVDHIIDGNHWGFSSGYGVSIDSNTVNASDIYWGPNNNIVTGSSTLQSVGYSPAVGSPNPNNISNQVQPFTFGWYGSTTNPALGNGTSYSYYKQEGRLCNTTFGFQVNTTTTVGSGDYSFQLPFKAYVTATGNVRIKASDGTYYNAVMVVQGGSDKAYVWLNAAATAFGSTSVSFGTNATFDATITYTVAPS